MNGRDCYLGMQVAGFNTPPCATTRRRCAVPTYRECWGTDGGNDAVRRYAATWKQAQGSGTAAAFVPLSFAPGAAYQFDWSHEVVLIDGVTVMVKVAHVRLCHSRMFFVRAYPRETQEMVFDAHDRRLPSSRASWKSRPALVVPGGWPNT